MTLRLAGSTSGYTEIDAPAVAGNNTLVLPGGNGSAHQILKNGATAGSLEYGPAFPSSNGTNGQVLTTNGSGALSWSSVSVTQLGSAATASGTDLQFNSGYGSVATAYGCRAWVNFNGTGTVAIRGSGNVSSITDRGTGNYTVNFTNALPDGNYSTVINVGGGGAATVMISDNGPNLNSGGYSSTYTTSSEIRFIVGYAPSSVPNDADTITVAVFR